MNIWFVSVLWVWLVSNGVECGLGGSCDVVVAPPLPFHGGGIEGRRGSTVCFLIFSKGGGQISSSIKVGKRGVGTVQHAGAHYVEGLK